MNVIIDPTRQTIAVDGVEIPVAISADPEISRITWDGDAGAITYRAPRPFTDFAIVQPFIDLYEAAKGKRDMKAAAEAAVLEVTEALNAFPDDVKIELAQQALQELAKIPKP